MKKILLSLAIVGCFAFGAKQISGNAYANAEKGLFIFCDSRPAAKFKIITTITIKGATKYSDFKSKAIAEIHRQRLQGADGIILFPDQQKAQAILFE